MSQKVQKNLLLYERVAKVIFFIALIIFLANPTNQFSFANHLVKIRLTINIIILLIAFATTVFLTNRRLKLKHPVPSISANLDEALQLINPIQNSVLRRMFQILPWILILIALMGITEIVYFPLIFRMSQNHYFGIATVALSLLAFQVLLKKTPETFRTLWNRMLISGPANKLSDEFTNSDELYKNFLDNFSKTMNNPRQVLVGLICGFVGSLWLIKQAFSWFSLSTVQDDPTLSSMFQFSALSETLLWIITFGIGYIVGLLIWRMVILGLSVHKLGKEFDLTLQRGHPDGCEGLAPLGNICLWNAIIISPAGIYLSARLVLGDYFQEYLYFLLIVVLAIAGISFFAPLWNIHKIMVAKKDEIYQQLNQLSQSINQLSRELLNRGSHLDPTESEKIGKKLDSLHKIYMNNQKIPVWPFNTRILARFVTSQIVPLLSLIGLGQPIIEIIGNIIKFINV